MTDRFPPLKWFTKTLHPAAAAAASAPPAVTDPPPSSPHESQRHLVTSNISGVLRLRPADRTELSPPSVSSQVFKIEVSVRHSGDSPTPPSSLALFLCLSFLPVIVPVVVSFPLEFTRTTTPHFFPNHSHYSLPASMPPTSTFSLSMPSLSLLHFLACFLTISSHNVRKTQDSSRPPPSAYRADLPPPLAPSYWHLSITKHIVKKIKAHLCSLSGAESVFYCCLFLSARFPERWLVQQKKSEGAQSQFVR